jgi:hypothetical protein
MESKDDMDHNKTSTVARILDKAQARHQDERKERKLAFTRALVHGIARLIEGQRQFADEFGLSLNRVFPNSYEALEGTTPTQLAISLFTADWASISELENLFDDLIAHQVALFSALDGIANETLAHMGDEGLGDGKGKLNDARAWRLHKERLQELRENDALRFEKLIAAGFVDNYAKTHERRQTAKKNKPNGVKGGKVA